MYRYRVILAIIALSALILGIISCAPAEQGDFLRALNSPASMIVAGERNGIEFSAEIKITENVTNSEPDGELRFLSPAALEGINVSTAGGVWNSSFDEIKIAGVSAELLGSPLRMFVDIGQAVSAEKIEDENGRALTLIVTRTDRGTVEYYIDSKSGYPLSITEKNTDGLVIMKFDIKEYKTTP